MPPFSKCYVLSRILVHGANCIEERHAWDTANRHYSRVLHQIPKTSFAGILDYSQNHQKCLCKFPHSNMLWAACLQGLSEQEVVAEGLRLLRSGREETVKGQVGQGGGGREGPGRAESQMEQEGQGITKGDPDQASKQRKSWLSALPPCDPGLCNGGLCKGGTLRATPLKAIIRVYICPFEL